MTIPIDIDKIARGVGMVKQGDYWVSKGRNGVTLKQMVALAKITAAYERSACIDVVWQCEGLEFGDRLKAIEVIKARGSR